MRPRWSHHSRLWDKGQGSGPIVCLDWNLIMENSFWCMECDLCGGEGARVSERSWTLAARHSWPYLGLLLWSGPGWEVPSRGGIIHKFPTQHHCVGVLHSRRESHLTSSLYHEGEGSDFVLHLGAKPQFRVSNFLGCPRWGLGRGTSWSEPEWCFFSDLCAQHGLAITNTLFEHKVVHNCTWYQTTLAKGLWLTSQSFPPNLWPYVLDNHVKTFEFGWLIGLPIWCQVMAGWRDRSQSDQGSKNSAVGGDWASHGEGLLVCLKKVLANHKTTKVAVSTHKVLEAAMFAHDPPEVVVPAHGSPEAAVSAHKASEAVVPTHDPPEVAVLLTILPRRRARPRFPWGSSARSQGSRGSGSHSWSSRGSGVRSRFPRGGGANSQGFWGGGSHSRSSRSGSGCSRSSLGSGVHSQFPRGGGVHSQFPRNGGSHHCSLQGGRAWYNCISTRTAVVAAGSALGPYPASSASVPRSPSSTPVAYLVPNPFPCSATTPPSPWTGV